MEELTSNGVEIYRFPVDDETVAEMNAGMNVRELINHVPSTLILSNSYLPFTPQLQNALSPWCSINFLRSWQGESVLKIESCRIQFSYLLDSSVICQCACYVCVWVSWWFFFSGANSICCCWKPWRGYYQQSEDESQTISLGDCRRYCTCTLFVTSQLTWKRSWLLTIVSC